MSLFGAVAETDRQGKEIKTVSGALAANGQLEIDTPYAEIDHVSATVKQATTPATTVFTYEVVGNTVTVYGWMVTATGDSTLIASTGEEDVTVEITGRRRR